MTDYDLILASGSPRRREILTQIGVRHRAMSADIAEVHQADESPEQYVLRLATDKARAIWTRADEDIPVLGADTIGVCCGEILEKPTDEEHAKVMLQAMSGRSHQVVSGIAMVRGNRLATASCITQVRFRTVSDEEIARYWRTGEPQDKSGGYAIQGLGAVFVEAIEGSYSNVVGLPIESLLPVLNCFNVPIWQSGQSTR